jgi:hypothetical protein
MGFNDPDDGGYTIADTYNIPNIADPAREELILGEQVDWGEESTGGLVRFSAGDVFKHDAITPETVREAAEAGYLSLDQTFNAAPSIENLVESAEEVNSVAPEGGECRLIGYVVSPDRADCRITIEGAYYDGHVTPEVRQTFTQLFGTGYEFSESETHLRRWHD